MGIQNNRICAMNQHHMYYPFSRFLRIQQGLNVQSVELWGGAPHLLLDETGAANCAALRREAEAAGMQIPVFCPEGTLYPYYTCAWDPLALNKGRAYYRSAIAAAKELGASVMVSRCCGGAWDEEPERTFDRAVQTYRILAPVAQDHGIVLAVEPVSRGKAKIVNTLRELQLLLEAVSHPALRPALDTAAACEQGESLGQWLEAFGGQLCHIHFTDSTPQGEPVLWGEGCLSLKDSLADLQKWNYTGYLGLQVSDFGWFQRPEEADRRNMEALRPFLCRSGGEVEA